MKLFHSLSVGDEVVLVKLPDEELNNFTVGKRYVVAEVESPGYGGDFPICVYDDDGDRWWVSDDDVSIGDTSGWDTP